MGSHANPPILSWHADDGAGVTSRIENKTADKARQARAVQRSKQQEQHNGSNRTKETGNHAR
jgi:hypothetical protein